MITKQLLRLSLILFALLTLTNCGTQAQSAEVPDAVSLRLNWVHQAQFAGFYVADQEGLYAAENLIVQMNPGGLDVDPIEKVAAREDDFGLADPLQILRARAEGKPIVAIAALFQNAPNVWISLAEKNIMSVQDMVGKRVGLKVADEAPYRMLLAAAQVDKADINEIEINDFTIRPLVEDEVDVLPGFALNEPIAARSRGYDINLITLADEDIAVQAQILFVHEDSLTYNSDIVVRFLRASLAGWQVAVSDAQQGTEATLRIDETLDANHQAEMMQATITLVDPQKPIGFMSQQIWQQTMQLALDQQLIAEPVDLDRLYTTEYLE